MRSLIKRNKEGIIMDILKIQELLNQQEQINAEIKQLNQKSFEINEELENYLLEKNVPKTKLSKRQLLESLGFTVSTTSKNGTQVSIIKNALVEYTVLFKQSKYYSESSHNAWYTFNSGIENYIDYVILEYSLGTGKTIYSIIDKILFSEIAEKATKFPDGRFNIYILGDEEKASVHNKTIDLTETLNNFDILRK